MGEKVEPRRDFINKYAIEVKDIDYHGRDRSVWTWGRFANRSFARPQDQEADFKSAHDRNQRCRVRKTAEGPTLERQRAGGRPAGPFRFVCRYQLRRQARRPSRRPFRSRGGRGGGAGADPQSTFSSSTRASSSSPSRRHWRAWLMPTRAISRRLVNQLLDVLKRGLLIFLEGFRPPLGDAIGDAFAGGCEPLRERKCRDELCWTEWRRPRWWSSSRAAGSFR